MLFAAILGRNVAGNEKQAFFRLTDVRYEVAADLRLRICFMRDSILELDIAPELEMDAICCRNVLMQFRYEVQLEFLDVLAKCLKLNGLLLIAPGEPMGWKHLLMSRSTDRAAQAYTRNSNNS